MAKAPPGLQSASDQHLAGLKRVAEKSKSRNRLRALYLEVQHDLERKLSKLSRGGKSGSFTAFQYRSFLAQIKRAQIEMAVMMSGEMSKASRKAQRRALNRLIGSIRQMEGKYGGGGVVSIPIEEASRMAGIIDEDRSSLMKMHRQSFARYGADMVERMQLAMSKGLMMGDSAHAIIDRIAETADIQWYQAERIVRTEQAYAYNAAQKTAMVELTDDMPDLMIRWVEHVDDSGNPLDDRVADDSIAMHGQVTKPGGLFRMPNAPGVSAKMVGRTWSHPPNRPNDRATIQPWRPGWGIPAYRMVGMRRVSLR